MFCLVEMTQNACIYNVICLVLLLFTMKSDGTGSLKRSSKNAILAFRCGFVHQDRDILTLFPRSLHTGIACMTNFPSTLPRLDVCPQAGIYLSFVLDGHQLIRNGLFQAAPRPADGLDKFILPMWARCMQQSMLLAKPGIAFCTIRDHHRFFLAIKKTCTAVKSFHLQNLFYGFHGRLLSLRLEA